MAALASKGYRSIGVEWGEAYAHLDEIRNLLFAGKVAEARETLAKPGGKLKLLMPYQPFCDVRLHFPGHGQATDFAEG